MHFPTDAKLEKFIFPLAKTFINVELTKNPSSISILIVCVLFFSAARVIYVILVRASSILCGILIFLSWMNWIYIMLEQWVLTFFYPFFHSYKSTQTSRETWIWCQKMNMENYKLEAFNRTREKAPIKFTNSIRIKHHNTFSSLC